MYWLTIEQISNFVSVAEEGSFNKASDKLGKAKSAIRYSVNALEEQLGYLLFDRSSYRPTLTSLGKLFLNEALKFLESYERLEKSCSQIASEIETSLALSVSGIFELSRIYPMIKKAMTKFPDTKILLEREILSGERLLLQEKVDLAIYETTKTHEDVESKWIQKVHFKLVIAANHPFCSLPKKNMTFEELYRFPQIIQQSTIPMEDKQVGVHEKAIKWKVTDTPSKKEIILNGFGWGKLPEETIEKELREGSLLHLAWLNDDDEVDVFICKRKHSFVGKVAQFFWDAF